MLQFGECKAAEDDDEEQESGKTCEDETDHAEGAVGLCDGRQSDCV